MGKRYLDLVRLGENQWWRYCLGLVIILLFWFVVGGMLYLVPLSWGAFTLYSSDVLSAGLDVLAIEGFIELAPPIVLFTATFLTFVPLLIGIWAAVRLIHQRPLRTLVTPAPEVNWNRVVQGFLLFGALLAVATGVEALLYPGRYEFVLDVGRFWPFLFVGLILIPVQTASEELLFRGYWLQGLSLLVKTPLLLCIVSGLLFALPHLANPELQAGFWLVAPQYFIVGFALSFITLKDNGLELALGVHTVNNLFVGLLVSFPDSAIQSETIFFSSTMDPVFSLISVVVVYAVFYLVMFPPGRTPPAVPADAARG